MTEAEKELRAERQAIMECERVPQEEIEKVLAAYPQIYGIADYTEKQGELI